MNQIEKIYKVFLKHPQICTDTRALKKDSLYFALKGENFNGNKFAEQALAEGCSFAVIDEKEFKKDERYFLVTDVLQTLQELASHHRNQLNIPFIGITGTNGKTTTKELIKEVLSKKFKTLATSGNLNNHIGVPLTILSITHEHEMAVIEMGANHIGEIEILCKIARPDHGIITNIGKAHLEGFGSPEGVIIAKSELYKFIRSNQGILFVNSDNSLLMELAQNAKKVTYGSSEQSDCVGEFLSSDPFVHLKWKKKKDQKNELIKTNLIGAYNFENILASICIGNYFGVESSMINSAIESYVPSNNRSQVLKKGSNTILLDAYNANPTSMAAAIENFSGMKSDNKFLVLGDMLELGKESLEEHLQIIRLLQKKSFEKVFLVGKQFCEAATKCSDFKFVCFHNSEEALEEIRKESLKNTTVLIKGSRGIKLEKAAEAF
jgi:UDP-N-acetylmuramoyl-tripeptide--D-alanyl-D-alanine ligase